MKTDISQLKFTDEIKVELIDSMGNDLSIAHAAWVSTSGVRAEDIKDNEKTAGLINFLMANRHGTPFEHGSLTFLVSAPIFVWREHHRHRIGMSYNEESGRYKQLDPVFYIPTHSRVQEGKPGHYILSPGSFKQTSHMDFQIRKSNIAAYIAYEDMLRDGVAREVARMVLPVNIFSSCYVTMNPRSLMAFLSLRTKDESSMFPSFPQLEIQLVAEQYERVFNDLFPLTAEAFAKNGRVGP